MINFYYSFISKTRRTGEVCITLAFIFEFGRDDLVRKIMKTFEYKKLTFVDTFWI